MSFYIKIDNPDAGKQTGRDAGLAGSPAEGPKKAFLVTAFTSVVGAAHPPHPPDRQRGGKDQSWVAVTLAATSVGPGTCLTISSACRRSNRSSARVSPYSGSRLIASNSANPNASYRYRSSETRFMQ